jgi:hypothetical protein
VIVYVAYADDKIGLPVAMGDSMHALAREIGSTPMAIFLHIRDNRAAIKTNKYNVPLTVYPVEIDYDPITDTDYDEGGE